MEQDADQLFREAIERDDFVDAVTAEPQSLVSPKPVKGSRRESWDLHGMQLQEAKDYLVAQYERAQNSKGVLEVTVITGKGRHSEAGGVLVRHIYDFVVEAFASHTQAIDSDPNDSQLGGLPLRGHFNVTLRF